MKLGLKTATYRLPVSNHLLPPLRDTSAISRLRNPFLHTSSSSSPISRTKKFQSFVNFALNKYQSPL